MSNKIYTDIPEIIGSIGAIGKTKKNQQQGYSFRGVDDVYAALNEKLAEHGVSIIPVLKSLERDKFTTAKGTAMFQVSATVEYHIFADDGSSVVACVAGEAMDSGDKATPKALSMAYKYMAFQVFCIPTDEKIDTEHDSHEVLSSAPPRTPPPQQSAPKANSGAKKASPEDAEARLRKRFFELIEPYKSQFVDEAIKAGWLLPTECLSDLPTRYIPKDKAAMDKLIQSLQLPPTP